MTQQFEHLQLPATLSPARPRTICDNIDRPLRTSTLQDFVPPPSPPYITGVAVEGVRPPEGGRSELMCAAERRVPRTLDRGTPSTEGALVCAVNAFPEQM